MDTMTVTDTPALHTSGTSPEDDWLSTWTARAPVLEAEKADEILELMGLL